MTKEVEYLLVDAVFKGDGTAVVAILECLVDSGRVILGSTESLDHASLSFRDGWGRRLVLVLLLLGVSAFAGFGVLAVGRSAGEESETGLRGRKGGTYDFPLSRSTMGMARDGEIAMRAMKSLKRADLDGILLVGVGGSGEAVRRRD